MPFRDDVLRPKITFIKNFYYFIFGYSEPSLLLGAFFKLWQAGAPLVVVLRLRTVVASLAVERWLSRYSSFSGCSSGL